MADEKPELKEESETSTLKVNVRSKSMIKKDESTDDQPATSHRGVTIKPLEVSTEPEPEAPVAVVDNSKPEIEATTLEKAEPELEVISLPANPAPSISTPQPPTVAPVAVEQSPAEDAKVPEAPVEVQSPKVFDTKQYHLPINEGVSGKTGKRLMIVLAVLLLVAVGGVVAIDAGWIDLGFKLPFDLIK